MQIESLRKLSIEKYLTLSLGLFWLIDGILQLQSKMFTQAFTDTILAPNLQNQPAIITQVITFGITIFKNHMLITNSLFASIQLLIGIVILLPLSDKWKKLALWISIPWALTVWIFGEGLGNLFTGSASFYTGAPGSVFLYCILAIFLLFPKKLSVSYLPRVAGSFFFLGGLLQESSMFWIKGMQSMIWQMSQSDTNRVLAFPAKILTQIATSTSASNTIAMVLLLIMGILLLVKPSRILGWVAIVFLLVVWWVGQDFGGIFTFPFGTATDPNSAPIFILFLLPLFLKHSTMNE